MVQQGFCRCQPRYTATNHCHTRCRALYTVETWQSALQLGGTGLASAPVGHGGGWQRAGCSNHQLLWLGHKLLVHDTVMPGFG